MSEKKGVVKHRLNESALRVSFLCEAAALLIQNSSSKSDAFNALSKLYVNEVKEVCFVEQLRVDKSVKRMFCSKCKRFWLPDKSNKSPFLIHRGNKCLTRKCRDCEMRSKILYQHSYTYFILYFLRIFLPFCDEFLDFFKPERW
uniref:Uncharacterized protein n=1 Tax=Acrobeloides nanus TaxID=290746 RepID=A0A914DFY8_9BILA